VAAVAIACVVAAVPAAQAQEVLGTFDGWSAFRDRSSGKLVCYVGAKPQKAEGKYTQRGDIYALVTYRPAEKVVGELSLEAGYTYKPGSEPTVSIGGRKFKLFTKGSNAWTTDARIDRQLVAAMKTGKDMVVSGVSARGTLTTDTYSLAGFSAALAAIDKACSS
jgi:hypothetical protein